MSVPCKETAFSGFIGKKLTVYEKICIYFKRISVCSLMLFYGGLCL